MIMLGEYPGRATLTVERLAQNINDCGGYGLADTAGKVLVGEPTDPDGPVAYHATVPVHEMVLAMRAAGIPADVSDAAGTFVCNHLMYGVLHHIASRNLPIRAGWVHLPVCRWSPPWIATWVFRACRWRRRSRDWSPASRRRCSLRPILASPSRHVCRSEGTKLLAARQSCPAVSYGTRNVALSRTNGPASSRVPLLS